MKLYITPQFRGEDRGDGGIRKVVEAQVRWLPEYGFEIVQNIEEADIVATHAMNVPEVPVNIPWVTHCHGLYWAEYDWPGWCYAANKQVVDALRQADHVTAPSEWVAQALRRGMWLKPKVIYHGVEPEEWEGGTNGGYVLWNKPRTDAISDPSPLDELARMAPDVFFITTFTGGKTMPQNMEVVGKLPYTASRELTKNAGVYLATTRETMGIGTLEAMAAGVPVLGWRWGGQAEIIKHGETGWLVTPGDMQGLLEGLRWCIANREQVGKAAKEDVLKRFTWREIMKEYAELYANAIEEMDRINKAPRISVVVPAFNSASFIGDTIESVQAQSVKEWEMLVVDDYSTDDTAQVAQSYADNDSRIKIIRNDKEYWLPETLNIGIRAARTRYIMNLDADNMITPNTLEVLSQALDADRSLHIAYGAIKFVLEDGVTPNTGVSPNGISSWPKEFSFREQMIHRNQIASTCLFRRVVWERTGGYRRRDQSSEDAAFWTRAVSYGFQPKKVTNAVTLIYRSRPDAKGMRYADPDWTVWLPWTRQKRLTPFGAAAKPPHYIGAAWPVPSCEPLGISVIIPVGKGHEELLIDALDSVEGQTYRDWEVIVVNDTGKPLNIPHSWARIIDTEGGVGAANARNLGIAQARTPLFVPLDADDYLQPECLEILYDVWKQNGGVVYSQWWDDKGSVVEVYNPPDYNADLLVKNGCIHAVTALYPKSAWEEIGGFDPKMFNWEDWDFQLGLAKLGICGTKVDMPLFTYRKTTGTRRESAMDNFERGKEEILSKWENVWNRKEVLMACGGCGKKTTASVQTQPRELIKEPSKNGDGWLMIEYIGGNAGTMTFVGKGSGTRYRFGDTPTHRYKYVLPEDAPFLLSMSKKFKVVEASPVIEEMPVIESPTAPIFYASSSYTPEEVAFGNNGNSHSEEEIAVAMATEKAGANRPEILGRLEELMPTDETEESEDDLKEVEELEPVAASVKIATKTKVVRKRRKKKK